MSWSNSSTIHRTKPTPPLELARLFVLCFYFLGLCLVSWSEAIAQNVDIRGIVTDDVSGERIPYANVVLLQTRYGASANNSGFYLIPAVPLGAYVLSVSAVGYQTKKISVTISEDQFTTFNIGLTEEAVRMREVTVTEDAQRTLTKVLPSVIVLDQRELKQIPMTVQEDAFRSLAILPGIVSTSDVTTQFYVRGGAGDQNLILLDGMRIYSPYHALGIFSIFDTDFIQNSTVYTGAFPAGYGGRLSSVVHLTSRDGRQTSPAAKAGVNLLSAKLAIEGPLTENIRFVTNARKSISSAPLTTILDRSAPIDFYDFFAKATFQRPDGSTKYGAVTFFSGDRLPPTTFEEAEYTWRNSVFGFSGSGLLTDRLYVSSIVYSSHFEARRLPAHSLLSPASSSVNDLTFRTDATVYTEAGSEYYFGFEFSFPSMEYRVVNSLDRPLLLRQTVADVSAWVRSNFTLASWIWDVGMHVDVASLLLNRSDYAIQPRLTGSLALDEIWRLKLAYGRFTQNVVTVNNEDDLITLFDAWIAVPDNIQAEHADHVVAGISGSLFSEIGLDVQAYFKQYGSLVSYNPDKLIPTDPDFIRGSGRSYGAEALLKYQRSDVEVLVSYALGWTTLSVQGQSYPPRHDRRHSVKTLTVYHVFEGFDLAARWDYGSGLPFTPTLAYYNRLDFRESFREPKFFETGQPYVALGEKNSRNLPPFHRLDLSAFWRFELGPLTCSIGASALNVYDRKNIFYFDRRTGRRVNSLRFFPSCQLTVEYR